MKKRKSKCEIQSLNEFLTLRAVLKLCKFLFLSKMRRMSKYSSTSKRLQYKMPVFRVNVFKYSAFLDFLAIFGCLSNLEVFSQFLGLKSVLRGMAVQTCADVFGVPRFGVSSLAQPSLACRFGLRVSFGLCFGASGSFSRSFSLVLSVSSFVSIRHFPSFIFLKISVGVHRRPFFARFLMAHASTLDLSPKNKENCKA